MALDRVQPVPWVLGFSMRRPSNQRKPLPSYSRSEASSTLCPPLQSTAQPQSPWMRAAASAISSLVRMVLPDRSSASGILGVMTAASGSSLRRRASMASSRSRREPEVATITGSTTMFLARQAVSLSAMASISGAEATMPVLTASGKISEKTLSSCKVRKSGVTSRMPWTPVVF